jgi:hypothetical protein
VITFRDVSLLGIYFPVPVGMDGISGTKQASAASPAVVEHAILRWVRGIGRHAVADNVLPHAGSGIVKFPLRFLPDLLQAEIFSLGMLPVQQGSREPSLVSY